MRIDMHVHSNLSPDSNNTLKDIEEYALKKGLDGVALCNHNIYKEYTSDKIFIIPAAEYSTDVGHILVYFLKSDIGTKCRKNKNNLYLWQDIVSEAHSENAICFLAHPFAPYKKRSEEFFSYIDGIEIINAKSQYAKLKKCNLKAIKLCKKYRLSFCAGSDSHFKGETGAAYTVFDTTDKSKIPELLLSGKCKAVQNNISPFYRPFMQIPFYIKKKAFKPAFKALEKLAFALIIQADLLLRKREKKKYVITTGSFQKK